jgi:diguanylate cyclase (GGDEF)-like protein
MDEQAGNEKQQATTRKRQRVLRVVSFALWGVIIAYAVMNAALKPSMVSIVTAVAFVMLFAVVNAQLLLSRWLDQRRFRMMSSKLTGTGYISELHNLPNRNYLLSELRREMPRARSEEAPFTLIVFELDEMDAIESRRGKAFRERTLNSAVELLKRVTRSSDFLSHLGGERFCVVLTECTYEQGFLYLKRVPGTIAVSDGRRMLEVRVTARMMQYDMESMYATDVLHDAEESSPLRRKEQPRPNAIAA